MTRTLRLCLALLAVAACVSARQEVRAPASSLIRFSLLVTAESKAKRQARIEIDVPGDVTLFEAPTSYAGAPMFVQYLSDITAVDRTGHPLAVSVKQHQVFVGGGGPKPQPYTLRYTYNVPQSKSGEVDRSLPTLDAAHGRFDNNLTFLAPKGHEEAAAELVVKVPERVPLRTSWGDRPAARVDKVRRLLSGMIVFGDFRYSVETLGKTRVTFALRGRYDDDLLRKQFGQVLQAQQDIVGSLPSSELLVAIQDTTSPDCKGTSLTNALVVNMPSGTALEPFNFQAIGTISHELFHQWNVHYLEPARAEGVYLLSEGFTNYFSVAALVRAGFIPPERFARFLWRYRQLLEQNPRYPGAGFAEIQQGFATDDENLVDLAYTKGPFVALFLDLALRDDTNGAQSATSWFRALIQRFGGKKGYLVEDLRALIVELSGNPNGKAVAAFDQTFLGGTKLDLDALFQRLGVRCDPKGECTLAPLEARGADVRSKAFSARL